jgi:hypothetical protein
MGNFSSLRSCSDLGLGASGASRDCGTSAFVKGGGGSVVIARIRNDKPLRLPKSSLGDLLMAASRRDAGFPFVIRTKVCRPIGTAPVTATAPGGILIVWRPSSVRGSIQLGQVQETALVPLYARALESRRRRPILEDPKAVEIVDSIDWDFRRFGQRRRVVGCTLRSAMFDVWVRDFLRRHAEGTVVEIGAGLNTRFERLDNGTVHWYDLELPDMVELRRKFFSDSDRRITLAASVLDPDWIAAVRRSPGPYFLVAETVFVYLEESQVKAALEQIASGFPEVTIALDTLGRRGRGRR